MCLNCIAERDGISVILTVMKESIDILKQAYTTTTNQPPITTNIKQQLKAINFLFRTSMKDSRLALFRQPGIMDILCTISSPSTYGTTKPMLKDQEEIQLSAISTINNLADTESLVQPMFDSIGVEHLIKVLCDAIEFSTTQQVRFYGIGTFTNILFVKGIPVQLYPFSRIWELALMVAESDDLQKWGDGKHPALGVIIGFATQPTLKSKFAMDERFYQLCVKVLLFKGIYQVPKFPPNANRGFTSEVKERALSLLSLLVEGDLNNQIKPKLFTNVNLIAEIRAIRASKDNEISEQFLAQKILHMIGLAPKPRRVMKTFLTRIYYRDGGVGMGIAVTTEMADDLTAIPRGPIHYNANARPDRTIMEPDGSRVEMRLSRVELLDGGEEDENANHANNNNNPGVAIVRPEDDLEESGLGGIVDELGAVLAMTMPGLLNGNNNNNNNGVVTPFIGE
jgi:hypothetical protein